jgi:predicted RNase H-like nuclease
VIATAILGIDPAWTDGGPSGVALLRRAGKKWTCVAVESSYADFMKRAKLPWPEVRDNTFPGATNLLHAAEKLLNGLSVALVCVDMPLSLEPITGRRSADNAISAVFCRWNCGTLSPTTKRPGVRAARIRDQFKSRGFPLATTRIGAGTCPALIEVYPHTALLSLLHAKERVPYKITKAAKYRPNWRLHTARNRVLSKWSRIRSALSEYISIPSHWAAPKPNSRVPRMKSYEDALDALICAWVGILYLDGRISAFGDATGAIWTPPLFKLK